MSKQHDRGPGPWDEEPGKEGDATGEARPPFYVQSYDAMKRELQLQRGMNRENDEVVLAYQSAIAIKDALIVMLRHSIDDANRTIVLQRERHLAGRGGNDGVQGAEADR